MSIRGYIELAGFIVAMFFVCAALWLWRDKDNAKTALIAAQNTIHSQVLQHDEDEATIASLAVYNTKNDRIVADFVTLMSKIDTNFGAFNTAIQNLRRKNAEVDKYLSQPIPDALLCLLNGVCPQATPAPAAK